jgi:hypothetical protein
VSFDTFLPVIALALFLAGLATLLVLFVQILRIARLSKREKRYRLTGWQSDAQRAVVIVAAVLVIALGNLIFWVNSELRMYTPVYPGLPLGVLSVVQTEEPLPRLVFTTSDREGQERYEVFTARDALFRISGERIRWSPQLAALGLADFFKATRITFFREDSTKAEPPTFSVDVSRGSTGLFSRLAALDRWLPFVAVDSLTTIPLDARNESSGHLYLDTAGLVLR